MRLTNLQWNICNCTSFPWVMTDLFLHMEGQVFSCQEHRLLFANIFIKIYTNADLQEMLISLWDLLLQHVSFWMLKTAILKNFHKDIKKNSSIYFLIIKKCLSLDNAHVVCFCICIFRLDFYERAHSHISQENVFSPVCIHKCFFN